jgi:nitrite reductase/ring-hydroxylating ferredoxin subunit
MATDDTPFVQVGPVEELADEGGTIVRANGRAIALFHHEGQFHAIDNRCPHMGFPLHEGSVEDGILTCHWHHARFELSCGDTFDPWADDVTTYPVEVRDDEVWVHPHPEPDASPAEHWMERLNVGLQENIGLVTAKATIGLLDEGVPYTEPLTVGVEFGTRYRESGWGSGLTILAAMANVFDQLDLDDQPRALYTGLRHVADNTADEPPRFQQEPFDAREIPEERLKGWFRENVEVRDEDGAERCLKTAVAEGLDQSELAEIVFAAATDHLYLDAGHTFDFINKAFETLDHVGWEHADVVLASLIPRLTQATRSEERSMWRQPIDVAGMLFDAYDDLPELVERGRDAGEWEPPGDFDDTLLADDPAVIVGALTTAVENGATGEQLARQVTFAAATRVAQFSTSNEFDDWNTVHHTFTYANAVHQATQRTDAWELYRGVFDAAMSVYLDRFLNTPPAPIPEPGETDADPAELRERLLDIFDEEGGVDEAGRVVAAYLDAGGDVPTLKETMGEGLLREDAGFHTLQNVEAAFAQYDQADDPARVFLIATARYMAAHFPTRREAEQTFTIADRLHRGEKIHEAD